MKVQVVTTITSTIDVDSFDTEVAVLVTPDAGIPAEMAKAAAIGGARALLRKMAPETEDPDPTGH